MLPLLILTVATMIAQTPYDAIAYNCWDKSTDLQAQLRENNISARIITGIINCNSGLFDYTICKSFGGVHEWIETNGEWIEATTGEVIIDRTPYKMSYYTSPKHNSYKLGWLEEHAK